MATPATPVHASPATGPAAPISTSDRGFLAQYHQEK